VRARKTSLDIAILTKPWGGGQGHPGNTSRPRTGGTKRSDLLSELKRENKKKGCEADQTCGFNGEEPSGKETT